MDIDSAGVDPIPGPRASLPAPSLHVPVVSPVWRSGFSDGCARGLPVRGCLTRREWQAMGDCGQGCPRTKVTRGPRTRCSPGAMGREGGGGRSMDIDSAGAGSMPGPRASLPASSLHVPVVSLVWRGAFGCVGFRAACPGWPDRAGVASDESLRARMPADQSASRRQSLAVWRSAPIDQSTGIGASG